MNILVTGGAGYIGTHTLVELLNRGHDVVVVDNYVNSHPESLDRVREITGKTFPFYEANVCDEAALDRIFDENKVDCVIHFAGLKAVGESCAKPLMYYRNNLDGMLCLISAMQKHGVKRFVFSSSATVYRSDAGMPVDEESPLGCINPYGWTKFMGEEILRDVARPIRNGRWCFCAISTPSARTRAARSARTQRHSQQPHALHHPDGAWPPQGIACVRQRLPHARWHRRARLHPCRRSGRGPCCRHRICEGAHRLRGVQPRHREGYSVLDIVNAFERVNHVKVPYEIAPRRAGDPPTVYAKVGKAENLLHWKARRNLDQMCADSWRWQSQNPHGFAKE